MKQDQEAIKKRTLREQQPKALESQAIIKEGSSKPSEKKNTYKIQLDDIRFLNGNNGNQRTVPYLLSVKRKKEVI